MYIIKAIVKSKVKLKNKWIIAQTMWSMDKAENYNVTSNITANVDI